MNDELPGSFDFADLPDGRCHFRLSGPEDGPNVLLLHGATVPGWEFDRILPYLNGAGFRTICPDLFGHGYSDRPRKPLDHALLMRQVSDLLDTLEAQHPVHIFGHSLGAAVAARLAKQQPERVSRLVMAAPLLDFMSLQPATRILQVPLVGELLMPLYVVPMLVRRRTARYRTIENGRFVRMFKDQLRLPGFGRALLSMMRSGALGNQRDCYEALQSQPHAVLVLRGTDDLIFIAEQMRELKALLPRAEYCEMRDMSHPLMLTHPEEIGPVVADFLNADERLSCRRESGVLAGDGRSP